MEYCTVPLPDALVPDKNVIQLLLVVADHEHPAPVETEILLDVVPLAVTETFAGDAEYEHGGNDNAMGKLSRGFVIPFPLVSVT